jgi:hypothetical protein
MHKVRRGLKHLRWAWLGLRLLRVAIHWMAGWVAVLTWSRTWRRWPLHSLHGRSRWSWPVRWWPPCTLRLSYSTWRMRNTSVALRIP